MIDDLIKNNKIKIFFQPIVSIKDKKIFAMEALTRAYDDNNKVISPLHLFKQAKEEKLSCRLDDYVRELAIRNFQDYIKDDNDLLLFLNFEPAIIDNNLTANFKHVVSKYNIEPKNIVIEIKEDSIKKNSCLKKFVTDYREDGFIIAIDDFGTGYSSFERLALIKPDIVKIDRSIIYDIHNNFINTEILNSISNMCHKIGAMVLSEGVEHKEEVLTCMKKDIDIFQGFYFCKATKTLESSTKQHIDSRIADIGNQYKSLVKQHINEKQSLLKSSKLLLQKIITIFESCNLNCFNEIKKILSNESKLQAIYILDEVNGRQIGKTIIQSKVTPLYKPSKDGHDHSLKEYYYIAKASSQGDYLSPKYISKATGNICRTYSHKIVLNNFKYILCCDIVG